MSDETRPDADTEAAEAPAHRPRATDDDDVEGHIGARYRVTGEDDDVEGHTVRPKAADEDDDVEGHTVRPK